MNLLCFIDLGSNRKLLCELERNTVVKINFQSICSQFADNEDNMVADAYFLTFIFYEMKKHDLFSE